MGQGHFEELSFIVGFFRFQNSAFSYKSVLQSACCETLAFGWVKKKVALLGSLGTFNKAYIQWQEIIAIDTRQAWSEYEIVSRAEAVLDCWIWECLFERSPQWTLFKESTLLLLHTGMETLCISFTETLRIILRFQSLYAFMIHDHIVLGLWICCFLALDCRLFLNM